MTASHWILLLLSVASVFPHAVQKSLRTKRNIMDLYKIVQCDTHASPLKFAMYGCYCGLGGHGEPQDALDRCCLVHDCCYEDAERQGCEPKLDHYHWTCRDDGSECNDAEDGSCESELCKCDREVAKCLQRHHKLYNPFLEIWPKMTCKDTPLQCPPKQ